MDDIKFICYPLEVASKHVYTKLHSYYFTVIILSYKAGTDKSKCEKREMASRIREEKDTQKYILSYYIL